MRSNSTPAQCWQCAQAFINREHEFRFIAAEPVSLDGNPMGCLAVGQSFPHISLWHSVILMTITATVVVSTMLLSLDPHKAPLQDAASVPINLTMRYSMCYLGLPARPRLGQWRSHWPQETADLPELHGVCLYQVLCGRWTDKEYRKHRCPPEDFQRLYGRHGIDSVWRWGLHCA